MYITLWPQKPRFYIANNYIMDDSLQKIVAAGQPLFSFVLLHYGSFTPEDAVRRKDIDGISKFLLEVKTGSSSLKSLLGQCIHVTKYCKKGPIKYLL